MVPLCTYWKRSFLFVICFYHIIVYSNNNINQELVQISYTTDCLELDIKVYLAGALINNANEIGDSNEPLMRDNLRNSIWETNTNYIPATEPYSSLTGFTHKGNGGNEQATPDAFLDRGQNSIVDWVFLEFRDKNNNKHILETRSAFVQRDGDIVDVDGVSKLKLCSNEFEYYVVVRHRNHLGVMSAKAENLKLNNKVDFTNDNAARSGVFNYGKNHPMAGKDLNFNNLSQRSFAFVESNLTHYVKALWLGNAKKDNKIKYYPPNDDLNKILFSLLNYKSNKSRLNTYEDAIFYNNADLDMNGKVKFVSPDDDKIILLEQVKNYPLNTRKSPAFDFLLEQIP